MSYNSDRRIYRIERLIDFVLDIFKTASTLAIIVALILFALWKAGLVHEIFIPR